VRICDKPVVSPVLRASFLMPLSGKCMDTWFHLSIHGKLHRTCKLLVALVRPESGSEAPSVTGPLAVLMRLVF
jgi:hypothetical protein